MKLSTEEEQVAEKEASVGTEMKERCSNKDKKNLKDSTFAPNSEDKVKEPRT
jgi:hypothetical protein